LGWNSDRPVGEVRAQASYLETLSREAGEEARRPT
jgi:hypothetical protein